MNNFNNILPPTSRTPKCSPLLSGFLTYNIPIGYVSPCGPGSVVGIATSYGLDGPGIESEIVRMRDSPHLSGPALGPHPASCAMGTGSFPGIKSGRGVMLTSHHLLVPWS